MSERAIFNYQFCGGVEGAAYHWTNPDGSKGGIVAISATVSAEVTISEMAEVSPGAYIGHRACIGYRARIGYHACIEHHAYVEDHALIGHRALIGGHAYIGDGAIFNQGDWLFTAGPQGSRSGIVSVIWSPTRDLRWWVGCQHGITTDALVARIKDKHGIDPHAEDYLHLIRMVETHPGLARAKAAHAVKEPE